VRSDIDLIGESLLLVKITGEEDKKTMNDIVGKLNQNGYALYISDFRVSSSKETRIELLNFLKFIKNINLNK